MNETAGQSSAYAQGMADPQVYQEQMQTMQQEFAALRDISNQTHLQNQQLQEANRCANAQLQQWAEHSRLQAEQLAAFQNREVDPNPHGDAHGPRNLNKPGGRSIRFESCDGKNSETTKAWFAMSRTRLLATGIDPKTKDAVLHVASFFTGPLGRWWAATIRDVDDACGNFGSVAELEAAAMSLHYIRDPCRSAYNKLSKLKQTGSVHQFKQALEELHFHLPKRSARCKLNDFLQGLKPHVREKIVLDYPESLEVAVRRALELDDNARNENYSDNSDDDEKSRNRCATYVSSQHAADRHDEAGAVIDGSLTSPPPSKAELQRANACFHCHRIGHKVKQCPKLRGADFDRRDAERYDDRDGNRHNDDVDDDEYSYGRNECHKAEYGYDSCPDSNADSSYPDSSYSYEYDNEDADENDDSYDREYEYEYDGDHDNDRHDGDEQYEHGHDYDYYNCC